MTTKSDAGRTLCVLAKNTGCTNELVFDRAKEQNSMLELSSAQKRSAQTE